MATDKDRSPFPLKTFGLSIIMVTAGGFTLGYILGCMNTTQGVFKRFLNQTNKAHYGFYMSESVYHVVWPIILNIQRASGIIAAFLIVRVSETFGRKNSFYISDILAFIGLYMQVVSKEFFSVWVLAIGRFITGFGLSLTLPLERMYLNEISPIKWRGFICSLTGMGVELGACIGSTAGLPEAFGTDASWPCIFAVLLIFRWFRMLVLPVMHESPRYLVAKGRLEEARKALKFFECPNVNDSIQEISQDICSQQHLATAKELWTKKHLRRGMFLGLTVVLAGNASGMGGLDYFSSYIIERVGLPSRVAKYSTVMMFCCTFLASVLSGFIADRVGRRPLLLISTLSTLVLVAVLMVSRLIFDHYGFIWAGYLSIAACLSNTVAFGMGLSVLMWSAISELVPQNARSGAMLLTMIFIRVIAIVPSTLFFVLDGIIGAYSFLVYIIPQIASFIILYAYYPETKGNTIVAIMKQLGYVEDTNELDNFASDL